VCPTEIEKCTGAAEEVPSSTDVEVQKVR